MWSDAVISHTRNYCGSGKQDVPTDNDIFVNEFNENENKNENCLQN